MHREGLFFGRMPGQEQSLLREGACIGEWPTKGKLMLMESVHYRMFFLFVVLMSLLTTINS